MKLPGWFETGIEALRRGRGGLLPALRRRRHATLAFTLCAMTFAVYAQPAPGPTPAQPTTQPTAPATPSAISPAPVPGAPACVPLAGIEKESIPLSGHLAILDDPRGQMTLEQAIAADRAGGFEPLRGNVSRGFGGGALWIRFCIPAHGQPRLWLRAAPAFIDHLTLYAPLAAGGYRASSAGDMENFEARELPFRDFLYAIDVSAAAPLTYYMQMRSSSSRAVLLELYSPAGLAAEIGADYIRYGIFTGIALLTILLNLALWLLLRVRTNLYYAGNVALVTWNILLGAGFIYQFWPALDPANANVRVGISLLLGYAGVISFLAHLFNLRVTLPWAHKAALGVAAACVAAAPFTFFIDWRLIAVPMQSLIGISQLISLGVSLWLFLRQPALRFYVIAFLPIQLNILASGGRNLGLLPASTLILESATFCSAVHICLLTVALARRAYQAEAEKKRAQDSALASSRQAERELELRVADRTAALSEANASLEREIATRQILQGELQQALSSEQTAHAAQKEFVSMVSHEFRNPLAVIDTVAQRMEETLTERHPDLVASAGRMRRSVARLLALIENCLTEDRLSSPYMLPRVTPVDLSLLLKTHYGDRGVSGRVRLHLPGPPVIVHIDAHLIGTAISNLVDNAIKYSPAHFPVEVSLTTRDGQAEIRVSDRGGGIVPEEQARIFEKFYRAAAAQRLSGAGLGLYLARELSQRHGGDVCLAYSSAEQGTCFSLTLPLPMQMPAQPHVSVI